MARLLVGSLPNLDVRKIAKFGLGAAIAVSWRWEDEPEDFGDAVLKLHRKDGLLAGEGLFLETGRFFVDVQIFQNPAGVAGTVRRFRCRTCGEPCAIIYFAKDVWACRKCHGLAYPEQSLGKLERAKLRFDKILADDMNAENRREWEKTRRYRREQLISMHHQLKGRNFKKTKSKPATIITSYELNDPI